MDKDNFSKKYVLDLLKLSDKYNTYNTHEKLWNILVLKN